MGGGEYKAPDSKLDLVFPRVNGENVIDLFDRMMEESTDPNFKALLSGITGGCLEDPKMQRVVAAGLSQAYKSISEGEGFLNEDFDLLNGNFIQKMAEKMIAVYGEDEDEDDGDDNRD